MKKNAMIVFINSQHPFMECNYFSQVIDVYAAPYRDITVFLVKQIIMLTFKFI